MGRRLLLFGVGIMAAALAAWALSSANDPYPLQTGTGTSQWNPAPLGTPAQAVVLYLQPRPGDRIELLGAETVGLPPAVQPGLFLSRAVIGADGTSTIGEAREPLEGAVIEAPAGAAPGPEHTVGIVAEMTADQAGTYQLTGVRLRFRTNGGFEQVREGITTLWTVCAADPLPSCEPPDGTDP